MQPGSARSAEPFFGFGTMGRRFGGSLPHKNRLCWGQEGVNLCCIIYLGMWMGKVVTGCIDSAVHAKLAKSIDFWGGFMAFRYPSGRVGTSWLSLGLSLGTEELWTNCCKYFWALMSLLTSVKCQSDKMGFGERMGIMGFAVGKSKGTDKGRPRQPNPLIKPTWWFNI